MGTDWTTGRNSRAAVDRTAPTPAQVARWEAEAKAKQPARKPRAKRKPKQVDPHAWSNGFRPFRQPKRLASAQAEARKLQAELRIWEDTVARNRVERRLRKQQIAMIQRRIHRLPC